MHLKWYFQDLWVGILLTMCEPKALKANISYWIVYMQESAVFSILEHIPVSLQKTIGFIKAKMGKKHVNQICTCSHHLVWARLLWLDAYTFITDSWCQYELLPTEISFAWISSSTEKCSLLGFQEGHLGEPNILPGSRWHQMVPATWDSHTCSPLSHCTEVGLCDQHSRTDVMRYHLRLEVKKIIAWAGEVVRW